MHLRKLVVRNFGMYRGEQVIDLSIDSHDGHHKPLVLIGGHNGSGKTTILEAVRLCLYGRLALGSRISDTDYQKHLRECIHRSRNVIIPVPYASVAIEFDYAHAGKRSTYNVQRAWEIKGTNGVEEMLRVQCDGHPLEEVESQFWPDFVRALVPLGVSQLFFFDGEKIKRLAEEESEAETLAESVKALLGLDLVERLQSDLDLYNSRYLRKTATGSFAIRLGEIETAEAKLKCSLAELQEAEASHTDRLQDLGRQIDRTEQQLAQRGEGLSAQRGELKQRKADLEVRMGQIEKELQELCDGPLPFALCPNLAKEVLAQMGKERLLAKWKSAQVEIKRALSKVSTRLTRGDCSKEFGWNRKVLDRIKAEVTNVADEYAKEPETLSGAKEVHGLSDTVSEQIMGALREALSVLPSKARKLSAELSKCVTTLREVQDLLNRVPDGESIAPIVKQLTDLQVEHANLALDLALKTEERSKVEREIEILVRERSRIHVSQQESEAVAGRLGSAHSVRRALDVYQARLTTAKIVELQGATLSCFEALCRKKGLVHEIKIDPHTYQVELFDTGGQVIPKRSLSAGEKQIYAISLLWALAKVSGRPLPVIIDTPLGRLDSVHRRHILQQYFPVASHQVIILSTDTEVDKSYFEMLKEHTSHCIHLKNHEDGWTEAAPGYFWDREEPNVRPAA